MIEFINFSFAYDKNTPFEQKIFNDINLKIDQTKTLLLGVSGSGKSSLFRLLLDDLKPSHGKLHKPSKIGFVFQNVYGQILMPTVYEELNLSYKQLYNKDITEEEIFKYFKMFKVDFNLEQNPHMLSGGQKRILVLICILISEPEYLILDEPFVGLDKIRRQCLIEFLKNTNIPFLISTHDLKDNYQLYNDIVLINKQQIEHVTYERASELQVIGKFGDYNAN